MLGERYRNEAWALPVQPVRAADGDLVCEIPYPDQPHHLANAQLIIVALELEGLCRGLMDYRRQAEPEGFQLESADYFIHWMDVALAKIRRPRSR
jgi:hypothetical protein